MSDSGVEFAKPFVKATINVLSTMARLDPQPGKPYLKKDNTAHGDVSAVIGFTGHKNGSFSVSFSRKCAIALVKAMLGDDVVDIVTDTKDAVGEISNMISGQARANLSELGLNFQGSTPSVIMGAGHSITHVTRSQVVAIPFATAFGDFTVEFCFEDS